MNKSQGIQSYKQAADLLWASFTQKRRRQTLYLATLMLFAGILEALSLGAIYPLLSVIFDSSFSGGLVDILGTLSINFQDKNVIIIFATIFLALTILATAVRVLVVRLIASYTSIVGSELSVRVFEKILNQNYEKLVSTNTSDYINLVTNKVNAVIFSIVLPLLTVLSSVFLFVSVFVVLLGVNFKISITAMIFFGLAYLGVAKFVKEKLHSNSQNVVRLQTNAIQVVQESIGGIRDIILDSAQKIFINEFKKIDKPLRMYQADNNYISTIPRYLMEALGICLIIAMLLFAELLQLEANFLPIVGVLGLCAQRMVPALQQIYSAWASISGSRQQLFEVATLLSDDGEPVSHEPVMLNFTNEIIFSNVSYRYPGANTYALSDVNVSIKKGSKVGIVGVSGSGKSTFLDLVMGMISPTVGVVTVDGHDISLQKNRLAWQKNIAHVPQSIFILDSGLAENIAFGKNPEDFNNDLFEQAILKANLEELRSTGVNDRRLSMGERGGSLSGGQRQRIGLARAIYKDTKVMILDEATSALDPLNEAKIMESIQSLEHDVTLFMISHNASILKKCDVIFIFQDGLLMKQTNYENIADLKSVLADA